MFGSVAQYKPAFGLWRKQRELLNDFVTIVRSKLVLPRCYSVTLSQQVPLQGVPVEVGHANLWRGHGKLVLVLVLIRFPHAHHLISFLLLEKQEQRCC